MNQKLLERINVNNRELYRVFNTNDKFSIRHCIAKPGGRFEFHINRDGNRTTLPGQEVEILEIGQKEIVILKTDLGHRLTDEEISEEFKSVLENLIKSDAKYKKMNGFISYGIIRQRIHRIDDFEEEIRPVYDREIFAFALCKYRSIKELRFDVLNAKSPILSQYGILRDFVVLQRLF